MIWNKYSRIEDRIISVLETKHQAYAQDAAGGQGGYALPSELLSLEKQVIQFFESKSMNIQTTAISSCHTLPRNYRKTKPIIIMLFVSRKAKIESQKAAGN